MFKTFRPFLSDSKSFKKYFENYLKIRLNASKSGDFCIPRLDSLVVQVEQRDLFRHKADAQQFNSCPANWFHKNVIV